jgi:hypothetical protein
MVNLNVEIEMNLKGELEGLELGVIRRVPGLVVKGVKSAG